MSVSDLKKMLSSDTPKKILVINCGSSSLKYTVYDTAHLEDVVNGQVERIGGSDFMALEYEGRGHEIEKKLPAGDHKAAFDAVVAELVDPTHGVISSPSEIDAIGHRIVHGGDIFSESVIIDKKVIAQIEELSSLAPLHNPVNLVGVYESQRAFPNAINVAVFDTAFHATIPEHAFLYGLPYEFYSEKKIRRYGFHGTSHQYVTIKAAEYLGLAVEKTNIITCHLGNGGSVCAVENGQSIDTSMGLTPTAGVIMGTRCGDIDPAALLYIMETENKSIADMNTLINKQSGLLGLSGLSNDMRDIESGIEANNPQAIIAAQAFGYSVKKYIGMYAAVLTTVDAVVFTGGIGLYNSLTRVNACKDLANIGISINVQKSDKLNGSKNIVEIQTEDSPVKILIIPTDEEVMIARDTLALSN